MNNKLAHERNDVILLAETQSSGWSDVAKIAIPAVLTAATAIVTWYLTDRAAQRKTRLDAALKIAVALSTERMAAHTRVFARLRALDVERTLSSETAESFLADVVWLFPATAETLVAFVRFLQPGTTLTKDASALAEEHRLHLLNQLRDDMGLRLLDDLLQNLSS